MLIKDLLPKKHLETPFDKDLLVKKDVGNIQIKDLLPKKHLDNTFDKGLLVKKAL